MNGHLVCVVWMFSSLIEPESSKETLSILCASEDVKSQEYGWATVLTQIGRKRKKKKAPWEKSNNFNVTARRFADVLAKD